MEPQLIEAALNAGGLALVALLAMHWHRSDTEKHDKAQERHAEALAKLVEQAHAEQREMAAAVKLMADAVRTNAESLQALKQSVEQTANLQTIEKRLADMERHLTKSGD